MRRITLTLMGGFLISSAATAQETAPAEEAAPTEEAEAAPAEEAEAAPAEEAEAAPAEEAEAAPAEAAEAAPAEEAEAAPAEEAEAAPAEEAAAPAEEAAAAPAEEAEAAPLDTENITIILLDGQTISGTGVMPASDDEPIRLTVAGQVLEVDRALVSELRKNTGEGGGAYSGFDSPYRGYERYLYMPSAIPMKEGTGYVAQKELFFTAAAYAVSDNFSVLAGTIVPAMLWGIVEGEQDAIIAIVGGRYAKNIKDDWYVGAGVEAFALPDTSLAMPFVNVTKGTETEHYSMGIGLTVDDEASVSTVPIVLAASKRISEGVALISENWLLVTPHTEWEETYDSRTDEWDSQRVTYWNTPSADTIITSFGVRFLSEYFTTDLSLINAIIDGQYVPFPWLDVAWHFGY